MCGIVAAVVAEGNVLPAVLVGLRTLEYRGYDSAGGAVLADGRLEIRRKSGRMAALEAELEDKGLPESHQAIGHTRWATHGAPADRNAHPHRDHEDRVVVVHNGIIENYVELRKEMQDQGISFSSETDTEVIANLLALALKEHGNLHTALLKALERLEGAYALVAMAVGHEGEIVAARMDSPLVLGVGKEGRFAASDMPALLHLTRDFVFLENGETCILRSDSHQVFDRKAQPVDRESSACDWTPEQAEKCGYPHFMLKEIEEQPDVLARTAFDRFKDAEGDVAFEDGFGLADEDLCRVTRLRFMAMGTSFHAALLGQQMAAELARIPGESLNASEFLYSPRLEEENALTVVVSQSGETADSLRAMREVKERGGTVLGICNVQGSTLAREADHLILTHCGPEVGVASTKAFFGQLTALYLLAIRMGRARDELDSNAGGLLLRDLREVRARLDPLFEEEAASAIQETSAFMADQSSCLFLGRGLLFPVALEGALKLKEISYIHAEGYPAGEMKHGPIALIDKDFPVVVVATPGRSYEKTLSNMEEVRARGGKVIAVGCHGDERVGNLADFILPVPQVPELLAPLVNVVPLQLLAYQTALILGRDIDQPRNLAKSVTVE